MPRSIAAFTCVMIFVGVAGTSAGAAPVALQSADPSCGDDSTNIYVDCGNGTVTDNRTGLVWLADADCFNDFGSVTWHQAMEAVAGLADLPPGAAAEGADCGLSDGSAAGEWRLPTAWELEAMMADALGEGGDPNCSATPPTVTNDSGDGCWVSGPSSFTKVRDLYWTATTSSGSPGNVFIVSLGLGLVHFMSKTGSGSADVWPVRGGQ